MVLEHYSAVIRGEPAWEGHPHPLPPLLGAFRANALGLAMPELPDPLDVERALAFRQGALRAALAFRGDELARLASRPAEGAVGIVAVALARRWMAVLTDRELPAEGLAGLEEAKRYDPSLAVEWQTQDSLGLLRRGDLEAATRVARRASRIAASDGVLQGEYLANLVLARVRRGSGTPHYAVRILSALEAVVPAPWRTWVQLEGFVAGSVSAGRELARALDEADPPAARARLYEAHQAARGFSALAEEVANLHALMDYEAEIPDSAAAFASGRAHETPGGVRDPIREPLALAFAVVIPGRRARRVLSAGLGLLPEVHRIEPTNRARRLHEALCAVFLAGEKGIERDRLFAELYGFPREDAGHDEVLRGLLHRMRRAEEGMSFELGARVVGTTQAPLAIPDPRCEQTLEDRVLTFLAAHRGRATAREIAGSMKVPLRTVQRSLGTLVETGACSTEADGRRTEYVVDDTTFSEPTLHRLRGRYR